MSDANDVISEAVKTDSGAWFETYGRILNKDRKEETPKMNYLQRRFHAVKSRFIALNLPVRILNLKPRQKGSTTFVVADMYHTCRRKSTSASIIGGQYKQTERAWAMEAFYFKNDKFRGWGNTGTINLEKARFSNNSIVEQETAKDHDAGRSGTIQYLLATEAARWAEEGVANAADVMAGILKCVPLLPDTTVVLETTANGASGDYYQRWLSAMDAEDFLAGAIPAPGQYVRVFAPWFEFQDSAVRLTGEQRQHIQKTLDLEERYLGERELMETFGVRGTDGEVYQLGASVVGYDVWEQLAWRRYAVDEECKKSRDDFNQDYPESWETAFLQSGRQRFNRAGLKAMKARASIKRVMHGVLDETREENRYSWRPTAEQDAWMQVWERPVPGRRYILSADVMTGESQVGGKDPDCHSPLVLREGFWENGRWNRPAVVARTTPPCRWDIDVLEKKVWMMMCDYGGSNPIPIAPEVNMDRGLIELLKLRGAPIYERKMFNRRDSTETKAYGWQTTPATREMIIENLARAIREWNTDGEGIDVWCPHILKQLENFITNKAGRSEAGSGHHDDDVISLAIALQLKATASVYQVPMMNNHSLPPDLRENRGGGPAPMGVAQFT